MDLLKQQTYLDASTLVCLSVEASESYLSEGEPLLLDFATVCKREIAFLCPPGHPERYAALSNLAVALQTRYDSSGVRADLEEAISLRREVLHSDKSAALKNLAVSLQARYEASGERGDLEEAADLHRLSLQLRPEGHPGQYSALMDLILSFESHFKAAGDRADLEAAISVHRESLNLRPTGHPDRSSSLHKLCLSLEQLYQDSQDSSVQTEITTLILEAITDVSSHLSQRLMTALNWVHPNHTMIDPPLRLHLYSESLSLLQMLITLRPGIDGQHKLLAAFPQIRTLAVDGAGEAIAAGELERAVSMLEQGRQVLLSSLQKYRTPLNELREVSPGLADELNSLSAGLDALSSTAAQWEALSYIRRDQLRLKQRKLSDLWDEILRRVRFIPGYEEYLLPPPYAKLQSAADQGPVVIVTGCKARSDALIVTKTGAPVLVPLENLTHKDLTEKRCKVPGHGFTVTTSHDETGLLESLWEKVVSPIVSRLRELGFEQGRIWWCPTSFFTTLPLHAAGKWTGEPDRDTHSSFIFSYTPTLSSLIRARWLRILVVIGPRRCFLLAIPWVTPILIWYLSRASWTSSLELFVKLWAPSLYMDPMLLASIYWRPCRTIRGFICQAIVSLIIPIHLNPVSFWTRTKSSL